MDISRCTKLFFIRYLILFFIYLIYRFFPCYHSFDALKNIPADFGRVGEEKMTEAIAFATESLNSTD